MTDEEVVSPLEEAKDLAQEMIQDQQENTEVPVDEPKEEHVPLQKFIKERKKRQELEQRVLDMEKRTSAQAEDTSMYETATKQDLGHTQQEIIRVVEERQWIKSNPEKYEQLNLYLQDFLEKRPHLAEAIKHAPNRWEEAYALMDALTPKQQSQMKRVDQKKAAPNSPSSVPKSAGIKEAMDVMDMTDAEYRSFRASKKVRR